MEGPLQKNDPGGNASEILKLIEGLSSAATITNSDNLFTYANAAFLNQYHYKLRDIVGLSPKILQPKKTRGESYSASCEIAIRQNKPWSGRIYNVDSKQNAFECYLCIIPLKPFSTMRAAGFLGLSAPAEQNAQLINDLMALLFTSTAFAQSESPIHLLTTSSRMETTRQAKILKLFNLSYSPKEIATFMNITTSTVNVVRWKSRQPIKAK